MVKKSQNADNKLQRLSLDIGLPVDRIDAACVHFLQGADILLEATPSDTDNEIVRGLLNQEGLRLFFLNMLFSVGETDPTFATMPHVDESKIPQPVVQQLNAEQLKIGDVINAVVKYGPALWAFFQTFMKKG